MENTKRDLSLDFTKPRRSRGGFQPVPSLVTPILNLSTPDFNQLMPGGELPVLTPNGISSVIPQLSVLPSPLTTATISMNNITNTNSNNAASQNNNSCVINYDLKTNNSLQKSDKYSGNQNQSQSQDQQKRPYRSREIDVDKIEKKREKNRLAAKKCRQRKIETIDELKKTVSERDSEIDELRKAISEWDSKYQKLQMTFEEFKTIKSKEQEAIVREIKELKNLTAGWS